MLRGSDEELQELKAIALEHWHVIKSYLGITISTKHTLVATPNSPS
ncbi:MAG: hypothetical protein V7L21_15240 [Nostoc sp.]|nr:hypothetical protein [Nostoc sp. NMS9]MBN3942340.1 hypothetical protein [Nostoc sp. NMS9]